MQILIETSKKENLLNNHFRIYETNLKKKKEIAEKSNSIV